jgi:hypothetical protein
VAVAVCLTLMPVAQAIEGDGGFAMFMAVSAVAAAGGATCTSVGDRSMRNYLKILTCKINNNTEFSSVYLSAQAPARQKQLHTTAKSKILKNTPGRG